MDRFRTVSHAVPSILQRAANVAAALTVLLLIPIQTFAQPTSKNRLSAPPLQLGSKLYDPEKQDSYKRYWSGQRGKVQRLEDCSWLVTYRKRIYDLSPLTRTGLNRPLDGDVRTILRRVPSAAKHLTQISRNTKEAEVQTALATLGLTAFLVTQIFKGNTDERGRKSDTYMAISLMSALLFVRSAYAGWQLKRNSKEELAAAIDSFNAQSPAPIIPYDGGYEGEF